MRSRPGVHLASFSGLVLLILGGCSSPSVPLTQLERASADAQCAQLAKCPQPSSTLDRLLTTHRGAVTCADRLVQLGYFQRNEYQASIEAGRITYDGAAAQRCLDAISSSCDAPDAIPACAQMWIGRVPLDGTCMLDEDCAGAARCDRSVPSSVCGTCVPLVALGQPCAASDECDQNVPNGYATCASTTDEPTEHCIAVTRMGNASVGERCGLGDQTTEPWTFAECSLGLDCTLPGGTSFYVCTPRIAVGQPCDPKVDVCADDALCAPNPEASGHSCRAVTIQTSVGQPCVTEDALRHLLACAPGDPDPACAFSELQLCNLLDRLDCVGGTCALVGTGGVGQPCRTEINTSIYDSVPSDCDVGLYCAGGALVDPSGPLIGACAEKRANDSACDSEAIWPDTSCRSGLCDFTNPAAPVCATPACR